MQKWPRSLLSNGYKPSAALSVQRAPARSANSAPGQARTEAHRDRRLIAADSVKKIRQQLRSKKVMNLNVGRWFTCSRCCNATVQVVRIATLANDAGERTCARGLKTYGELR